MYRDDIKLFAKNEKMETLIQTVRKYSQDIGIEFGIDKRAILVMKSGKWHIWRNRTTKSRENQNVPRKSNLGNFGSGQNQTSENKRRN